LIPGEMVQEQERCSATKLAQERLNATCDACAEETDTCRRTRRRTMLKCTDVPLSRTVVGVVELELQVYGRGGTETWVDF
jgi:hypothetical protein